MRLISYESKMTSKSGKKKKVANKLTISQYIVLNISQYNFIVLNIKYISTCVSIIHIYEGNYRYAVHCTFTAY